MVVVGRRADVRGVPLVALVKLARLAGCDTPSEAVSKTDRAKSMHLCQFI
ncbi:hypothetical protein AGR8A_pTi10090 [Agrobacterium fabrum str. J-07]|nr:hypothetical protein AGR8A_pTi10090 [Agrobacterium fabrum str. J-07]